MTTKTVLLVIVLFVGKYEIHTIEFVSDHNFGNCCYFSELSLNDVDKQGKINESIT